MLAKLQRRVTIRLEAGKRRFGRGNLWHDGANRQRRRRCGDRRRVLAIEATVFGATGAICVTGACLRSRLPQRAAFLSWMRRQA